MPEPFVPADQSVRDAITQRLDESLVVEAGAGTGKTHSLVDRILALVEGRRTTLDRLAAITFTEAAAAELRERVRAAVEDRAATQNRASRNLWDQALADLDRAAIQTLHSFAASILRERPLESGLPPGFDTLDAIQSEVDFQDRWDEWLDQAMSATDPADPLLACFCLGMTTDHLHRIAKRLHEDYDLARTGHIATPDMPATTAASTLVKAMPSLEGLCGLARLGQEDPLVQHIRRLRSLADRLQEEGPDTLQALALLAQNGSFKQSKGKQADWDKDPSSKTNGCKVVKDRLQALEEVRSEGLRQARQAALGQVLTRLRDFVLAGAADRRKQGRASFHDLLVWARDLLRDNLDVRDHFRRRYSHLLIDEMQDTDPIQAEIAFYLAEEVTGQGNRPTTWTDVTPTQGKLFVVGDPKQSIYRFRRADVGLFRRAQTLIGGEPQRLTQSFRSQRSVVQWTNHVFSRWMAAGADQPLYSAIDHRWEAPNESPVTPVVHCLGGLVDGNAEDAKQEAAEAVTRLVSQIKRDAWPVLDETATRASGEERHRPAELRDICLLMPTRTGQRHLELALEAAGVPYRLESASLVFATQEVRDLLNCLRAIDNPADQVALVAALRSPAFACSDVDLLRFVGDGGRWDYLRPGYASEGPVVEAMSVLRDFHGRRMWMDISALIEDFLRDRRLNELALAAPRPREQWRRYRLVADQASAVAAAGVTSLKRFLDWAQRQEDEQARLPDSPTPETDEDAVRVMTVHGSKGLEFPVVVLLGIGGDPVSRGKPVLFTPDGSRVEVRIGGKDEGFETVGYSELFDADKAQEADESVRLMYVAATRARDHLIVSLHRGKDRSGKSSAAAIQRLMDEAPELWEALEPEGAPILNEQGLSDGEQAVVQGDSPEARAVWVTQRDQALARAGRTNAVAATTIAHETWADDEGDAHRATEQPWRRGRAATNMGRAVHAVLQTVDLETGAGVADAVRGQADAEGVPERFNQIKALVEKARTSDTVVRALRAKRHWREVPVTAPTDAGGLLEGFIDLLFEEDDGLVVVDYKTDALDNEGQVHRAVQERYRLQGGAYAAALERATGRTVKEVVFLFLEPHIAAPIEDLEAAKQAALEGAQRALNGIMAA